MIKVSNLTKYFGEKKVIDIPSFTIKQGEMLGLVGNNGAGKTTLFRLMLDLLDADCGQVVLTNSQQEADEVPATSQWEEWKNYTGAYIDGGFLIDFLTPNEYFEFVGKAYGLSKDATHQRLELYNAFLTEEITGQQKYIRNLSAGNQQKVGIVGALLNKPDIVILDEPFNFLDPSSQNQLKHLLVDYNKQTGATIVVSSHNLQHTIEISSRIALMENGLIIKDLTNENKSAEKELESYFNI